MSKFKNKWSHVLFATSWTGGLFPKMTDWLTRLICLFKYLKHNTSQFCCLPKSIILIFGCVNEHILVHSLPCSKTLSFYWLGKTLPPRVIVTPVSHLSLESSKNSLLCSFCPPTKDDNARTWRRNPTTGQHKSEWKYQGSAFSFW